MEPIVMRFGFWLARGALVFAALMGGGRAAWAQGIPEPSLVFYGVIRNTGDNNVRLTTGTLLWQIQPSAGGNPITISTSLTNINDQFSYVLRVPCETFIGSSITSNTLRLIATAISYDRSRVFVMSETTNQATILQPASATFLVTSKDRGRIERVDLGVYLPPLDSDGDGIPDAWEIAHGLDRFDRGDGALDYDGDGISNLAEYKAGTDPNDPSSRFAFIGIEPHTAGGILIRWASVAGESYELQRSSDLLSGFTAIASNLPATATVNSYRDAAATGAGPYFYRLRLHE